VLSSYFRCICSVRKVERMRAIVSREVSGDYFILSGGGGVGFGIVDSHLVRDYYSSYTRSLLTTDKKVHIFIS